MIIETMKNGNDQIRYTGNDNEGKLIYGKMYRNSTRQGVYYIKNYKFKHYTGYVHVSCEENYQGKWYMTAYVNITGVDFYIQEQKHCKNPNVIYDMDSCIREAIWCIEKLTDYMLNYLDKYICKKPRISNEIKKYKYSIYPERIFKYKGNEYLCMINVHNNLLMDINPQGNEMFKVV